MWGGGQAEEPLLERDRSGTLCRCPEPRGGQRSRSRTGRTPAPVPLPRGGLLCANAPHPSQRVCPCRIETDKFLAGSLFCFLGLFFFILPTPPTLFSLFLFPRTMRNFKKDLNVISESNIYDLQ